MTQLANEGYVLSVLAEVAERANRFSSRLSDKLAAAETVRNSITETLDRMQEAKAKLKQARGEVSAQMETRDVAMTRAAEAQEVIDRAERRLKELNKMLEFGIEDEALFQEMGRAGKAKNDKAVDREKWRQKADAAEQKGRQAEQLMKDLAVELESRARDVKDLQRELPDPHLFAWLGLSHFGRANANYLLAQDAGQFDRVMREGVGVIKQMHTEMREGRYRLDRYGDLLAGRHECTVQALYGAVAIGDMQLAQELFSLAADPGMFFHQIFNVFRTWMLGAFLLGDTRVMARLLRDHRFEKKLWQGYVRCFRALNQPQAKTAVREFSVGMHQILRFEVRADDLGRIPGTTLVHLPALALCRLARARRLVVEVDDKRLPPDLLRW